MSYKVIAASEEDFRILRDITEGDGPGILSASVDVDENVLSVDLGPEEKILRLKLVIEPYALRHAAEHGMADWVILRRYGEDVYVSFYMS